MIWPFKKKSPIPKEYRVDVVGLTEAAKTLMIAAVQHGATRLRHELQGFSGPGIPPSDWVVEARRKDAADFLIWSEEHRGWWGPDHRGYVQSRKAAGRYTLDEAIDIVKGANRMKADVPNEGIVLADDEV